MKYTDRVNSKFFISCIWLLFSTMFLTGCIRSHKADIRSGAVEVHRQSDIALTNIAEASEAIEPLRDVPAKLAKVMVQLNQVHENIIEVAEGDKPFETLCETAREIPKAIKAVAEVSNTAEAASEASEPLKVAKKAIVAIKAAAAKVQKAADGVEDATTAWDKILGMLWWVLPIAAITIFLLVTGLDKGIRPIFEGIGNAFRRRMNERAGVIAKLDAGRMSSDQAVTAFRANESVAFVKKYKQERSRLRGSEPVEGREDKE